MTTRQSHLRNRWTVIGFVLGIPLLFVVPSLTRAFGFEIGFMVLGALIGLHLGDRKPKQVAREPGAHLRIIDNQEAS